MRIAIPVKKAMQNLPLRGLLSSDQNSVESGVWTCRATQVPCASIPRRRRLVPPSRPARRLRRSHPRKRNAIPPPIPSPPRFTPRLPAVRMARSDARRPDRRPLPKEGWMVADLNADPLPRAGVSSGRRLVGSFSTVMAAAESASRSWNGRGHQVPHCSSEMPKCD